MNKVAFIFRTAAHGCAAGREGLDAALATSALDEEIGIFFIGDGVYQLLAEQAPTPILQRHYAPTFGLFELYDVEHVYICSQALTERGVSAASLVIIPHILTQDELQARLAQYSVRLSF